MPDTRMTVILPDETGQIEQTGSIILQRGELAVVHRFTYAAGQGLLRLPHVLPDATAKLADLEASPPPEVDTQAAEAKPTPRPKPKPTSAKRAAPTPDDDTPDWMKPNFGKGRVAVKPVTKNEKARS